MVGNIPLIGSGGGSLSLKNQQQQNPIASIGSTSTPTDVASGSGNSFVFSPPINSAMAIQNIAFPVIAGLIVYLIVGRK